MEVGDQGFLKIVGAMRFLIMENKEECSTLIFDLESHNAKMRRRNRIFEDCRLNEFLDHGKPQ